MSQILFAIALNASIDDVNEVIDAIRHQFGVDTDTGVVLPSQVAAAQSPAGDVTSTAAVELDAEGLPWDERIHSSNKALNANKTWRAKRNVTPQMLGKVKKELLAAMAAAPSQDSGVATLGPAPVTQVAAAPILPGLPPLPGANVPTEAPAYTAFVKFVAENTKGPQNPAGRLTADWINTAIAHFSGVPELSLQTLAHRIDLIPQIEAGIRTSLGQ